MTRTRTEIEAIRRGMRVDAVSSLQAHSQRVYGRLMAIISREIIALTPRGYAGNLIIVIGRNVPRGSC